MKIDGSICKTVFRKTMVFPIGYRRAVILMGNFCMGKCNRIGVTIQVEDDIFTGVTKEGFQQFFEENVLTRIEKS